MLIEKTGQGRVRIYDVETGEPLERWPVDARGMVEAGTHTYMRPEGKGKAAKAAQGEADGAEITREGPQFEPVVTPSMDPVLGTLTGEPEQQLGAATTVNVGVPAEGTEELASGAGASAKGAPVGELPRTTPLGERAVYSRAGDASTAQTDQAPVRRGPKPKGR